MSENNETISINLDGENVEVPTGINVIEAAAHLGKEIPHYCYHPHLSVVGNCRMCMFELGMPMKDRGTGEPILDENGEQKIGFMPKPAIACSTKVAPGMHVRTDSEMTRECQQGVMEFLLVNHPLDCPICDQAGECRLQEFATDYGRGYSRFVEEKNPKPKRTRLGPRVMLDDERCILCSRCVRFCNEIVDDDVLGFIDRGSYSTLTCYPGRELENNYSLNTVDICPVGALTSTDFRFKMRVWFLKPVNSICTESSVGVNTQVWSREGKIYRVTPRRNDAVNDSWMSDSGRALYKLVDAEDRLKHSRLNAEEASFDKVAQAAATYLRNGKPCYVGSGHMTLEEQFMMRELSREIPGPIHYVHHQAEGDGLLISADRTPNLRGALVTGLIEDLPGTQLDQLGKQIDAGEVDTILVQEEDLLDAGLTETQLQKVNIIYLGTRENATSKRAEVVLSGLTVFEKNGSFINQQFRLQKFNACIVPHIEGTRAPIAAYARIKGFYNNTATNTPNVNTVWQRMAGEIDVLKDHHYSTIPEEGVLIDGSRWEYLPFCEGKTLHYNPESALSAAESA